MQIVPNDTPPSDTRSLSRAAALLRLLSGHGRAGWRITDLAGQSGLDPATVHRLLRGLGAEGLVTRVPGTRHYALGPGAHHLGLAAAPWYDVDRVAGAALSALARELDGTVFVKVRDRGDSVCVARHDRPRGAGALLLDVGGRRPLCTTAGGVALWLALPRTEQRSIEADNAARHAGTWRGVRRMLARSRRLRAGVNLGDIVPGICALAVALPALPASLTLGLTDARLDEHDVQPLLARLQTAAHALAPAFDRLRY